VTRDPAKGVLYLKLVNASSSAQQLKISLDGVKDVKSSVKLITLSAATTAETNSITDPQRVLPVNSTLKIAGKEFVRTVPGYSIEVLEISAQ
jgi:alpha-N-arabinofuranosidase